MFVDDSHCLAWKGPERCRSPFSITREQASNVNPSPGVDERTWGPEPLRLFSNPTAEQSRAQKVVFLQRTPAEDSELVDWVSVDPAGLHNEAAQVGFCLGFPNKCKWIVYLRWILERKTPAPHRMARKHKGETHAAKEKIRGKKWTKEMNQTELVSYLFYSVYSFQSSFDLYKHKWGRSSLHGREEKHKVVDLPSALRIWFSPQYGWFSSSKVNHCLLEGGQLSKGNLKEPGGPSHRSQEH